MYNMKTPNAYKTINNGKPKRLTLKIPHIEKIKTKNCPETLKISIDLICKNMIEGCNGDYKDFEVHILD